MANDPFAKYGGAVASADDAAPSSDPFAKYGGSIHHEEAPEDEGPSILESGARGFAQGATLSHEAPVEAGLRAAWDKVRGAHEDLGRLYAQHLSEAQKANDAAQAANPLTYGAARIGGGFVPFAAADAATGGAATATLPAFLATSAGAGAVDASGESKGNVGSKEWAKDVAGGAVGGAASGALGVGAGKVLAKGAEALAPSLQKAGDVATMKAAGNIGTDLKKMAPEDMAKTAQYLRDQKIVTPLTTVEKAGERASEALEHNQKGIGDTLHALDAKAAEHHSTLHEAAETAGDVASDAGEEMVDHYGKAVNGADLADAMHDQVLAPMWEDPNRSTATINKVGDIIQQYRDHGPMTLNELDTFKRGLQSQVNYGPNGNDAGMNGALKDMAAVLRSKQLEAAKNIDPELGAQLEAQLGHASTLHPIADTAVERSQMLSGQNAIPLGGKMQLAMAGGAALSGNVLPAAGMAASALANKSARQYGNSIVGTVAPKAADAVLHIVKTNPTQFGKYGVVLANALRKSPAHYAAANMLLQQTDPTFQAMVQKVQK